ncbi:hypothetical protein IV102_18255 [bacterium]|nr:hypothetical protein [bacterium]
MAEEQWTNAMLTPEQCENLEKFFADKPPGPCSHCGANNWGIGAVVTLPANLPFSEPWIDVYGPSAPMVMVYCGNCANARFYSAKLTGALPVGKVKGGALPPPRPINIQVSTPQGKQTAVADFTIARGESATISSDVAIPMTIQIAKLCPLRAQGDLWSVTWPNENSVSVVIDWVKADAFGATQSFQTELTKTYFATGATQKLKLFLDIHATHFGTIKEDNSGSEGRVRVHVEQYIKVLGD